MPVDPARFDEFVIESMIGEGGMGKVYRARQTALDRWVALKVLPRAKENRSFIERFYREARSAARLVHPNIIQIHTVGEIQGVPYFTMEYVEGVDLEHIVHDREHLLGRDEIVEIARSVVKALAVAAEQGVVHRDIKPANIMISKTGLVKVMDFGLAKELDHNITQSGVVVGTPTYMSPEQGSGQTVDFRSDLYSLGCVLYEIVKGQPPFTADKVAAVIYKHMFETPSPISPEVEVDQLLEEFIMKLLKKKPEDRYQTPEETLDCLAQIYCNHAAAELSLSRHAQRHFKARKVKEAEHAISQDPDAPKGLQGQKKPHERPSPMPPPQAPLPPPPAAEAKLPPPRPKSEGRIQAPSIPDVAPPPAETTPEASPAVQTQRVKFLRVQKPNRPSVAPEDGVPAAPPPVPVPPSPINLPSVPKKDEVIKSGMVVNPELVKTPVNQKAVQGPPPKPLNMLKPHPKKKESSADIEQAKRSPSIAAIPRPSSILAEAEIITRETTPPVMRIHERPASVAPEFIRGIDGRWTYVSTAARCTHAEGMAHSLAPIPTPTGRDRGLGDCLLCPNWNEKSGCAMASCQELLANPKLNGLKLLSEMATAWMGAGRFDRAIQLLNEFVEDNPNNPDGYRELARIYDRPDYKGRDKRRGIIMYMRFIDLARADGSYSQIEISRAEARANALKTGVVASGFLTPGEALEFDCFYRGAHDCYVFGRATSEMIAAVRIGVIDPHTGNAEPDPSAATSTLKKAVSIFSRNKTEQEKQEEQTAVRKELLRLQDLDIAHVLRESSVICHMPYDAVISYEEKAAPPDLSIFRIKEKSATHNFVFVTRNQFKGQQLRELLRRRLARKMTTSNRYT